MRKVKPNKIKGFSFQSPESISNSSITTQQQQQQQQAPQVSPEPEGIFSPSKDALWKDEVISTINKEIEQENKLPGFIPNKLALYIGNVKYSETERIEDAKMINVNYFSLFLEHPDGFTPDDPNSPSYPRPWPRPDEKISPWILSDTRTMIKLQELQPIEPVWGKESGGLIGIKRLTEEEITKYAVMRAMEQIQKHENSKTQAKKLTPKSKELMEMS